MKRCLLIFSISIQVFLFLSCSTNENKRAYFVVPSIKQDTITDEAVYYGDHNFIFIDSTTLYYYYYKRKLFWCGTGIDFSKPLFISIKPKDLFEMPPKRLTEFLEKGIHTYPTSVPEIVSISSFKDTIRNPSIFTLLDKFKPSKKLLLTIRIVTEEERYVATSKKEQLFYNPKNIDWKTKFGNQPPPVLKTIKFLPPDVK